MSLQFVQYTILVLHSVRVSYLLFITFLQQFLFECWVLTVDMGTEPKHQGTVYTGEAEFGRRESELAYHKEGWVWPWWR